MATYNAKTLTITNNGDNYIIDPLQGNDVAYRDITVNIDAEYWTLSNNIYSYVWTNNYLTQNSQVQVYFKANVRGGLTGDLRVQKTTGHITFSTGEEPTDDISLLVRIIDANTTGILPINADMVETDAIVGETDVQGALEDLDERVRENSDDLGDPSSASSVSGSDAFSKINSLNNNITTLGNKLVNAFLTYDSANSVFPLGNFPAPRENSQVTFVVRNVNTGAIYVVWFSFAINAFVVGATLSGNAPGNGEGIALQYFA